MSIPSGVSVTSALIARRASRTPLRMGFTPTPAIWIVAAPATLPATRKNAAAEMSRALSYRRSASRWASGWPRGGTPSLKPSAFSQPGAGTAPRSPKSPTIPISVLSR